MAHQLHYASVPRGSSGRAGFQFTARSCGAPPGADRMVERFMTYRPPAGASVERCPVSLAYDCTPHGAIVVCCRYLGADYSGRPGNFLGHAVVAAPEELDGVRPIELWNAPWWADAPAADSLPTLPGLLPGDAIDPDRVGLLLARHGQPGYQVLTTLVDAARDTLAGQAGPVMLVSDDIDQIALWIAAVSYSLPFAMARDMSFVTYTNDPLSARHHLVGTTHQAWAASRSDGVAHFLPTPPPASHPGPHDEQSRRPATLTRSASPSPYAAAAAAAWRSGDLVAIDALCAIAATEVRSPIGESTVRDSRLDMAAALFAWRHEEYLAGQHWDAAVRGLANQALANADPADPSAQELARIVIGRYPAGPSTAESSPTATADRATPAALAASARMLLAATGVTDGCARSETPERIAEHADQLMWWRPYADPDVAERAARHAARLLAEQPVVSRVGVLRAASPPARQALIMCWLSYAPHAPDAGADLAEIAVRLRASGATAAPLTEHLVALARRPFAFRKVHSELQRRSPELADQLRELVDAHGGGWRAVFRRPAGS